MTTQETGALFDRLIPIALMIGLLIPIRRKLKENPEAKTIGIPIKIVIIIIYVAIAADVLLLVLSRIP